MLIQLENPICFDFKNHHLQLLISVRISLGFIFTFRYFKRLKGQKKESNLAFSAINRKIFFHSDSYNAALSIST